MKVQPLIAVKDVQLSSRWYQSVLGLRSGHGGCDYERLFEGEELLLQLHRWDVHDHPHLGQADLPCGNGVLLWFQTERIDESFACAQREGAEVLQTLQVNDNAGHLEFWLKDPEGYVVVVAGARGDLGLDGQEHL